MAIFLLIALSSCSTKEYQHSEPVELTISAAASLNKKEAELFLSYLKGKTTKTIFKKYGFIVLD